MTENGLSLRWRRRMPVDDGSQSAAAALQAPGCKPLVARLLAGRGLTDADQAQAFLHPKLTHLHDPALMPNAIKAARRIAKAAHDKQPIVIYGDYDVDGVTASAILWHTLKLAGADVSTYVPHRIDEGYGLSADAIRQLARGRGVDGPGSVGVRPLIVSVDCGVTAVEPAAAAKEEGADLIITDHHSFAEGPLPDAYAIVHPRLPLDAADDSHLSEGESIKPYPFGELCGAGVALKLAWQIAREISGSERLPKIYRDLMLDLLSLAALGTVADVVPLVDENRVITRFGLGQIKRTRFHGVNALIDAANLRGDKVDAYHVGFILGPRLNACGRMGHAEHAVRMLTDAGPGEAMEVAKHLTKENERRRETERAIVEQAIEMISEKGYDTQDKRAIVVGAEGWHAGVIGIVASRLVERYHRPTVVLSFNEDGVAQGSARSVGGVSILACLRECESCFLSYGGHAAAAGMRLNVAEVDGFRDRLIDAVNQRLAPEDLAGEVEVDEDCDLADVNLDVWRQIESLAPFGRGAPAPVLCLRGVRLYEAARPVGETGKHLKMRFTNGDGQAAARRVIGGIGFGLGDLADRLPGGVLVDVVFEPKVSQWQGQVRADMHVRDLKIRSPQEPAVHGAGEPILAGARALG